VGERGTWYPNFGLSPAQFDMEFHYPANWTLVATGKQIVARGRRRQPKRSRKPLARKFRAGPRSARFLWLGSTSASTFGRRPRRAHVLVEAYGTKGVEKSFPKAQPEVIEQPVHFPALPVPRTMTPMVVTPRLHRRRAMCRQWPTRRRRPSQTSRSGLGRIRMVRWR
jgi:hypothetical protein